MTLALEALLRLHPDSTRRFLAAALAAPLPELAALIAAGVPHYQAVDLCRRLRQAGEIGDSGWVAAAQAGYAELLAPARRLDRLDDHERPREKALRSGIAVLADAELLALLLRTGSASAGVLELAETLIADHGGLIGLAGRDVQELVESAGLGPAKAAEIAAAFELGRRLAQSRRRTRPRLSTPEEVVEALAGDLVALVHEEFWCLPLDGMSRLLGEPRQVSRGDVDGTEAGPRAFYRHALTAGAVRAIAVHNHPDGNPEPSPEDRAVTRRLVAAGRTVDIHLVDHLVLGDGGRFVSLRRDEPQLFA